jgi:hypothetical protein
MSTKTTTQGALPTLPPNVVIFSPTTLKASKALLKGKIFTKLATTTRTTPSQIASALSKITPTPSESTENFCLAFRKGILIFDGDNEIEQSAEELTDAHHEHFRQVCLALKDADINLDFSACIFDVEDVLKAGFQLDEMSRGAVLVIDLMDRGDEDDSDDDDDDDSDEDDEATEASLKALVGGNTVEAQ